MTVTVYHCVCRTCRAEAVVTAVRDRATFYERHAGPDHDALTRELTVPEREGDTSVSGAFHPEAPGATDDGAAATPD